MFVTLMRVVRGIYEELGGKAKDWVDDALVSLYYSRSHLLSV